jgi:uncharacterized protein
MTQPERVDNDAEARLPGGNMFPFLNRAYGVIGRTVSTKLEPNTSSRFVFWLGDRDRVPEALESEEGLEIGNIVAALAEDEEDEITFGTVVEMRSYSDVDSFIADYLSHNFGDADLEVPTDVARVIVVSCEVMRNLSGRTRPVGACRLYFPTELGIRFAYGIVDSDGQDIFQGRAIPIGVFRNGDATVAAVSVDEDFMVGPEGAHLNVSGISGLASKTSAVLFITKSLLTHTGKRVAVVMFNVKSKDLLYIDQPNPRIQEDQWSADTYAHLRIPTDPFVDARFFAPGTPMNPQGTQSRRLLPTERFSWDLQQIHGDIPSMFDPDDWDDKLEGAWYRVVDEIDSGRVLTYQQMLVWINTTIGNAGTQPVVQGQHIATWRKLASRLRAFPRRFQGLIQMAGEGADIPWTSLADKSVFVIDMAMLSDKGKKLVFSRAIREMAEMMEDEESGLNAVVVFVDELNKFAPSGSIRSPLKSRLVDITARGRSIGLVLFGAEQFASSVEKEVVENCSTFLFGRTEATELRAPAYSGLSDEVKAKLSMLPQGQLLAKSAKYAQPLFVKFPFPPCLPGDQYHDPEG